MRLRRDPRVLFGAVAIGIVVGLIPSQILSVRTTSARDDAPTLEPAGNFPGMRYRAVHDAPGLAPSIVQRARRAAITHPAILRMGEPEVVAVRAYGPFARGEVSADDPCRARACVNVTVALPPTPAAFEVFVSARSGRVLAVERSADPPALSPAERRRAHRIAEDDPQARALVSGEPHRHPAALTKPMWPSGICDLHRCGTVIFTFGDLAETGIGRQLNVLVDVTTGRVLERTQITCRPACAVGWDA